MDIEFSDILSIIALLVSALVAFSEYKREYKLNTINIEFEFYREIFQSHLITKLPEARRLLFIDPQNRLQDIDPLVNELNQIRQDSLYFLYNKKSFYETLKEALQDLEDYLINSQNRLIVGEDQTEFYTNLQTKINKIYKIISDSYLKKN